MQEKLKETTKAPWEEQKEETTESKDDENEDEFDPVEN